jgi:gamma-aminobutyric acid type B receptor
MPSKLSYLDGEANPVALFEPSAGQLDFSCGVCHDVSWLRGVPAARRLLKKRIETIAPAAFLVVTSLALIGIVLALTFLAFNLHFRKIKFVDLHS